MDQLEKAFAMYPKATDLAIRQSLYRNALLMFAESQIQVPFREGHLQKSGFVEPPTAVGQPEVIIGYGGDAVDYAIEQHENLEYNHATVYNGFDTRRKAKFLEDPVLAGADALRQDLEERIKAVLK